jgi:hypothetical protein
LPLPPLDLPLSRLQRWMQAVIEQPGAVDEAVEAPEAREELDPGDIGRVILPSKTLTSVERVGVYQGMYLLRMVEALENDYPALAHFLGQDAFADLVTRYVAAHPSRSYTLNRLGSALPEFIRTTRGIRKKAFDADRSPAWPAGEIERLPQEAWPGAVFVPIAAFRLLAFSYPVNAYFQSVKDENHDHPDIGRKPTWVVVWRKNYEVWRLNLGKDAYEFLRALANGRPFGKAVAVTARKLQGSAGDQLFRWLRDWVAEGMFQGVRQGVRTG